MWHKRKRKTEWDPFFPPFPLTVATTDGLYHPPSPTFESRICWTNGSPENIQVHGHVGSSGPGSPAIRNQYLGLIGQGQSQTFRYGLLLVPLVYLAVCLFVCSSTRHQSTSRVRLVSLTHSSMLHACNTCLSVYTCLFSMSLHGIRVSGCVR